MNILILSQTYYPDTVATAQLLHDLSLELDKKGHTITVITSQYNYENKAIKFKKNETQGNNITIKRLNDTGLGKGNIIKRLIDFGSFALLSFWYLINIKRRQHDIVIGMTSPPLISFLASTIKNWKQYKIFYWTMDLQPELAIQSEMIKKGSITAKLLQFLADYTLQKSDKIAVLDRYMEKYVSVRSKEKEIFISTLWTVVTDEYNGTRLENPFRIQNNFGDKIVIMYSGNHAYVHKLDTLLDAAKILQNDDRFLFVFVGGGVRKKDVTDFKQKNNLNNIVQLPYQPRNYIHISLAASDFQVVVMGDGQVGYTHPNKIYGALFVGKPIIYIGPVQSHITDILDECSGNISVRHEDSTGIVAQLTNYAKNIQELDKIGKKNKEYAHKNFDLGLLKSKMVYALESMQEKV